MSLTPGSRLGPYEIVAVLGAGGMGEVYRARDARIGRDVAVKVLPPMFAASEDRRRRFDQEARAAGSISHPSLLTIFDVGDQDGLLYIVTELLEGSTLRERLQQSGSVSQRRAVDYALQIARAAAVAHDKNIVHRDLKPDNIFITADERVKLLDFGLAKVLDDRGALSPDSPTEVQRGPNTSSGMVLGTVFYMAPEQVRAQAVDARTDIFSFGVVLYEMLTGALPFRGDSHAETMAAIVNEDPAPMRGVAPALEKIVLHALEKAPWQRFQSMRDVAFALETFSSAPAVDAAAAKPRTKPRAASPSEVPAHAVVYRRVSYRRGFVMSARFAPDGSVVYGAAWEDRPPEIFAAFPANPESRPLGLGHADVLAIAANGEMAISLGRRFVGGWVTTGRLARVPLFGGAPREIAEDIADADWDPKGKELAGIRRTPGGFAVEMPLGNPIFTAPHWLSHVRVSPNGDRLAFLEHELWGDDAGRLVILDRQGKRILQSEQFPSIHGVAWRSNDEVLTCAHHDVAGRDMLSITVKGKQRIVLPVPGRFGVHDIARDGRVLASLENGRREIVTGTRGEERERNITWLDWSFLAGFSPDGKVVLFEEQGQARRGGNAVYVRRTDGSPAVRLGEGTARAFSPDGTAVGIIPHGAKEMHIVPIGVGTPRSVPLQGLEGCTWWDWTPDGRAMIVWAHHGEGSSRHFVLPLDGSGAPRAIGLPGPGLHIATAPDSKSMLVSMHDRSVAIVPLDGGEPRPVPGTRLGDVPLQWSEDGNSVFVFQSARVSVSIDRIDLATGTRTEWHTIQPADPAGVMDMIPLLMSRDGQQYAYCYRRFLSDLYIIEGL
ncbi:MAG TPA: protein kinase [Thermoanaerobaculia bacterium]|nr:protein kinase [Thermoanaerobaculia bacterium]